MMKTMFSCGKKSLAWIRLALCVIFWRARNKPTPVTSRSEGYKGDSEAERGHCSSILRELWGCYAENGDCTVSTFKPVIGEWSAGRKSTVAKGLAHLFGTDLFLLVWLNDECLTGSRSNLLIFIIFFTKTHFCGPQSICGLLAYIAHAFSGRLHYSRNPTRKVEIWPNLIREWAFKRCQIQTCTQGLSPKESIKNLKICISLLSSVKRRLPISGVNKLPRANL